MKAPKCQFCGVVEWRHVCDQTPVVAPFLNPRVVKVSEGTPKIAVGVPGGKFDRKKYQREYMRAWRKKK